MTPSIYTFTQRRVNPLDVRPEDVCVEDVAHHLSCINRFNGALRVPISVAQHAVWVAKLCVGTGYEWEALHHDDGEAYCGDMTKWLKESPEMTTFREAESRAQLSCYQAFGISIDELRTLPHQMRPIVNAMDKLMVKFEAYQSDLMLDSPGYGPVTMEELHLIWDKCGRFRSWNWEQAEEEFLNAFSLYSKSSSGIE